MPIPVVAVMRIVGIQVPIAVDGCTTIPPAANPTTAISAASYRRLAARRGTVLRYRQRSSTREQRGYNRESLQGGHHVRTPKTLTPILTQTRRCENASQDLFLIQI